MEEITCLRKFLLFGNQNCSASVAALPPKVRAAQFIKDYINQKHGEQVVEEIVALCEDDVCLPPEIKRFSIFTLALCARSTLIETKQAAYKAFPKICIRPDELFRFVDHCEMFSGKKSGWGRAHKAAISGWYNNNTPIKLAIKVTQCLESRGWCHKDLIKLAHIVPKNTAVNAIFKFLLRGEAEMMKHEDEVESSADLRAVTEYLQAVHTAKHPQSTDELAVSALIEKHGLIRCQVATTLMASPEVWRSLVQHITLSQLLQVLPKLSVLTLLNEDSLKEKSDYQAVEPVVDKLKSKEEVKTEKIHPFTVMIALLAYEARKAKKGTMTWKINPAIVDALLVTLQYSIDNVKLDKHILVASHLDSSKMVHGVQGTHVVKPQYAVAAMALLAARLPGSCTLLSYTLTDLQDIDINKDTSLHEISKKLQQVSSCITDPGAPLTWALERIDSSKDKYDVFIVMSNMSELKEDSDAEEMLKKYRDGAKMPNARMILWNFGICSGVINATKNTILHVSGFDDVVIRVVQKFIDGYLPEKSDNTAQTTTCTAAEIN